MTSNLGYVYTNPDKRSASTLFDNYTFRRFGERFQNTVSVRAEQKH